MKKLLLLSLIALCSPTTWAAAYKTTTTCQFDYDDFEFCSKSNIIKYKTALAQQKPNFDTQYILLNVGTTKFIRYVAIDTKSGMVFPLIDTILGFKDQHGRLTGRPPIISYKANAPHLCIQGSVDSYRNSYDNIKLCYAIQYDEFSKYKKDFNREGIPESLEQ